jgi:protein involved in polysaccharide export with SLBB domain
MEAFEKRYRFMKKASHNRHHISIKTGYLSGTLLLALLALVPIGQAQQSSATGPGSTGTQAGTAASTPVFRGNGSADPNAIDPSSAGSQDSGNGWQSGNRDSGSLASTNAGGRSLSPDEIFSILQQQPDALVELKSLMADLAQQQGTPVQPDSITDQMLYGKIATSPELRANISTFLRVRGYVSDNDLESYASGRDEQGGLNQDFQGSQGSLSIDPRMNRSELASPGYISEDYRNGDAPPLWNGVNGPYPSSVSNQPSIRRNGAARQTTSDPQVLHRPTPYNMLSLRDLYTQLPQQSGQLKRFGSDFFTRRDTTLLNQMGQGGHNIPLDVPAGPDYVVGPGDSLTIDLWGGVSQTLTRTIDREGRIALPESGAVQVAGLSLERVQAVITEALKREFRDLKVAVTVDHLRSIRVYVVGDVQRPGAYDISSLSSSLNAIYAAGGPTSIGSLRKLRHYRGKQLVGEIDLYDFLLHGLQTEDRLAAGDTLLVPPAGPQISMYGSVRRPAIYELRSGTSLATALEDAGGVTVAAELSQIVIERIDANQKRETIRVNEPAGSSPELMQTAIAAMMVHDGDRVHVAPILPYSQRVVYLEGHVARPGRMAYREGMQLNDILHTYQDLLPEPADKGEIVRLVAPDLHPETIQFNVPEVLIGNANIALQPLDTIRIYGRYEADAPRVTVGGEVLRPGTYSLSAGMTAAQLVLMAGGFKRDALLENADLISYQVSNNTRVISERTSLSIGDAVLHARHDADVTLKPGDVLTIHQISGWNDIGSSITIEGEVTHPGSYGIQQGERLSSILRRAGGFRDTGYPTGAVLLREDVRRLEEKSRDELIHQIETTSTAARIGPNLTSTDQTATLQLIEQQQQQVLARLKSQPVNGRLVIHISGDIASWENTPDDVEVRAGDVLRIPKRPGFVLVNGQVYNASAITFTPGKTAAWYLRRAGGATDVANTKDIFIIRANGSVVGRGSGSLFDHGVLSTRLEAGDVVVVPQKIIGASLFWRNLLTVAQVASSVAITAAVAGLL